MKWIKSFLLLSLLISIAACSAHKKQQAAVNDENAAYGAQSQGLNGDDRFNDSVGGERLLSKKTYYFDFDSNVVHEDDRPAIESNADYLVAHPNIRVILEGHTDPRGSREYNIGLGERRAKAVAEILTAKGVRSSQIRLVSYGAEKLASPGRTDSDFQLDRRVVLVYMQ